MKRIWLVVLAAAVLPAAAEDYHAQLEALAGKWRHEPLRVQLADTNRLAQAAIAVHEAHEDGKAAYWGRQIFDDATPGCQALEALVAMVGGEIGKVVDLDKAASKVELDVAVDWAPLGQQLRSQAKLLGDKGQPYFEAALAAEFFLLHLPPGRALEAWSAASPALREKLAAARMGQEKDPHRAIMRSTYLLGPLEQRRSAGQLTAAHTDLWLALTPGREDRLRVFSECLRRQQPQIALRVLTCLESQSLAAGSALPLQLLHQELWQVGLTTEAEAFLRRIEQQWPHPQRGQARMLLFRFQITRGPGGVPVSTKAREAELAQRTKATVDGDAEAWLALADLGRVCPEGVDVIATYRRAISMATNDEQAQAGWEGLFAVDRAVGWAFLTEVATARSLSLQRIAAGVAQGAAREPKAAVRDAALAAVAKALGEADGPRVSLWAKAKPAPPR